MPLCETVRTTPHPGLLFAEFAEPEAYASDLLYLFACSLRWRDGGDTTAGWDLIAALRSSDETVSLLSASLLFRSRIETPPWKEYRQFGVLDQKSSNSLIQLNAKDEMNTPYGIELCDNCVTCKLNKSGWFCHLSHEGLRTLSTISHLTAYPGGALLFVEGQTPRGAFIVCSGRVKLSTTSRDGKGANSQNCQPRFGAGTECGDCG